ncbi:MAG: PilN domain-containing protein [Deltaproteobacteria bacterium]|nr:PilN domain-containing protein [Deltaproteobacteria bacterium]
MIKINLLPYREERKKADLQRQIIMISGIIVLFLFIIGAVQLFVTMSVSGLERDVAAAEQQLTILTKITGDLDKYKKDKETLEKKIAIIDDLEKGRSKPVRFLDDLAAAVPIGKIWLTAFKKDDEGITIEGVAIDNIAIALFMQRLQESSMVTSVDLISSEQVTVSGVKLMNFTLSCNQIKG